MKALLLVGLTALAMGAGAPWWVTGLLVPPALLWAPGLGFARRLGAGEANALQRGLDAAWLGMGLAWVDVAVVREVGLRGAGAAWGLVLLALAWSLVGQWVGRRAPRATPPPRRETVGLLAVLVAVAGVAAWRAHDLARPLDGYWYLDGATDEEHPPLPVGAGRGWRSVDAVGWPEAGALRLVPGEGPLDLVATGPARGRILLAVRGPLGSSVAAGGARNTVARAMTEEPSEGPVRRYLDRGVAAIAVDVDLGPGDRLPVAVEGETVYLMPGTEAVWALHASGALRNTHYYQILNQVENLVWAQELLEDRWFTWNQPPGWSPLLAVASLLVMPDLPAGNLLFLWVVALVGATGVRLGSLVGPGAPWTAWLLPAGMAASHGLLMIEPASTNFPDSLFAAGALAVAVSLALGRRWAFVAQGLAAQALRWPGTVVATLLALAWGLARRRRMWRELGALWGLAALGALAAALLSRLGPAVDPDIADLGFILYFETFPEHWHGRADPALLLPRIPGFYGLWLLYTGGGLLLAAVTLLFAPPSGPRAAGRALLGAAFAYSLLLCTVDHHPTHYFLPLVALTGPALWAATATLPGKAARHALAVAGLVGLWIFLWRAVV